jgi:AraC family transcriptional regulator
MDYRIEHLKEKKLIGKKCLMSFASNRTAELWKSFMPCRKEIENSLSSDLYSMQIYTPLFFERFDPKEEFEKWAAMEVRNLNSVPDGMQTFVLPAGMYAVFLYKG